MADSKSQEGLWEDDINPNAEEDLTRLMEKLDATAGKNIFFVNPRVDVKESVIKENLKEVE